MCSILGDEIIRRIIWPRARSSGRCGTLKANARRFLISPRRFVPAIHVQQERAPSRRKERKSERAKESERKMRVESFPCGSVPPPLFTRVRGIYGEEKSREESAAVSQPLTNSREFQSSFLRRVRTYMPRLRTRCALSLFLSLPFPSRVRARARDFFFALVRYDACIIAGGCPVWSAAARMHIQTSVTRGRLCVGSRCRGVRDKIGPEARWSYFWIGWWYSSVRDKYVIVLSQYRSAYLCAYTRDFFLFLPLLIALNCFKMLFQFLIAIIYLSIYLSNIFHKM